MNWGIMSMKGRSESPYKTIIDKEVLYNYLGAQIEALGFLCIPEIFGPCHAGVRLSLASLEGFKTFSESLLAHWGPAPNIDATSLPGCDLRPP